LKATRLTSTKKCIVCKTSTTKNQWYRGPKCASCYHKKHYLSEARKFGYRQKYQRCIYKIKKRKIPFTITIEQYKKIIDKGCFYCSKNLYKETGLSLDRKNGSLGYSIRNVLPCCGDCNTIRFNILTVQETIEVIELLRKIRNKIKSPWE